MIYCFDLDGTICSSVLNSQYNLAVPDKIVVDEINRLYDEGNKIIIMTARGSVSKIDHTNLTRIQLKEWGVKHHELIMHVKPHADWFIDDKAIHISEWKKRIKGKRGIVAGSFDVIHPGYIRMFKEAKKHCSYLTIALHEDPSTERKYKVKPVHTVSEREEILLSLEDVDEVVHYSVETEFLQYLKSGKYDVRFLGSDYADGSYTGYDIDIEIVWLNRDHQYSTTRLKSLIHKSIQLKREGDEYYD